MSPQRNPGSASGSSGGPGTTPAGDGSGILGSNPAAMRAHNERLVLSLIRRHGATAKADIARATGLSAQTVSVIMRALEADGLLLRRDPVRGRVGQPSVPMALAPDGAFFFGLKVGRRSLELVLTNFVGEVLARMRQSHRYPMPEPVMAFVRRAIESLTRDLRAQDRARIGGLGIAMPYRLWDWAQSLDAPQEEMDRWRGVDLRGDIAARYDFPVYIQNDATAACGAELVFGAPGRPPDFLYVYLGYFIGGGVVLGDALYPGPSGNAGALGSMPVPLPGGAIGQLIDVASLSGLERQLARSGGDIAAFWEDPARLTADDDVVAAWIRDAATGIAHAILSSVSVIDFPAVLLDGWLPAELRARLVDAVRSRLDEMNAAGLNVPDIRAGTIGPDARTLGAASLPLSERFLQEPGAMHSAR